MFTINPIIPIWLMAIICVILLLFRRKGLWPYVRQIILIALLFLINLRVMVPSNEAVSTQVDMDLNVVFVIDDTISMLANDYPGGKTRLEGMKSDCEYIIDSLYGSRFTVITFHNSANLLTPLSDNVSYTKSLINAIYPLDQFYAHGTTLNTPIAVMQDTLKQISETKGGNTIVFFISDGEITNGSSLESYSSIKGMVSGGAVLGYGTESGGKMYVKSYSDQLEVVQDKSTYPYTDAISKIDEGNLKQIASDLGVEYINMQGSKTEIDRLIKESINNAVKSDAKIVGAGFADIYFWLAIPVIIILVFEFIDFRRRS